jgi:hypothetical protein
MRLLSVVAEELACSNFFLFNDKLAPLTFIADFPAPDAPVSEFEEHAGRDPQGGWIRKTAQYRSRFHARMLFIPF